MHDHHRHQDPTAAAHGDVFESAAMVALAELHGEVLAGLVTQAASVLGELCRRHGVEVTRVLDLGCGAGAGTTTLAQRFPAAGVVAVDGSAAMLERVTARAERLGLSPRVQTRLVELPAGLGTLGPADVVWASMSLHHMGDEVAALRGIRGLLEPGGLLAVVEQAGPLRVHADDPDLGRPGLWERLDAAWATWFTGIRAGLGARSSADPPALLEAAGFELVADERLTLVLDAPLDAPARRLAHRLLPRLRPQLGSHADAGDLDALDPLVDERSDEGVLRRDDLRLSASHHLYIARPLG